MSQVIVPSIFRKTGILLGSALLSGALTSSACVGNTSDTSPSNDTLVSIPAFVGDKTLTFHHPQTWHSAQQDGLITVAPFPPPHRGLAGTLPEGMVITILPYQTALHDTASAATKTLDNGTWTIGSNPQFPGQVVYYTQQEMSVSAIAAYSDEITLTAADLATIESVCASMALETGGTP